MRTAAFGPAPSQQIVDAINTFHGELVKHKPVSRVVGVGSAQYFLSQGFER